MQRRRSKAIGENIDLAGAHGSGFCKEVFTDALFLHVNAEPIFMPSNFILLDIHRPSGLMRSA